LQPGTDRLVIGELVAFRAACRVLGRDGRIDVARVAPPARIAASFVRIQPSVSTALEMPSEGLVLGRSLRTDGQKQCHGLQQAARHHRHCHANCEHESVRARHPNQDGNRQEHGAHADSDEGDDA
jgi:hypothetical protein